MIPVIKKPIFLPCEEALFANVQIVGQSKSQPGINIHRKSVFIAPATVETMEIASV